MKQVAQNYRSGELTVLDAPPPRCAPGGVLVRTLYSLISTGTELMKVNESKMSLVGKARARPDQVRKVFNTVAQQGAIAAYQKAINRLDSYTPLGYSLAGVVIGIGEGADELRVGQLVACAGNEFALHAELNWVPVNLCAPVPDGVPPQSAAFATIGAIALQGVRQAEVQLGDTACVIGLGLVGQMVVQLLVANGARVVGVDVVPDRCRLAEKAGALVCVTPDDEGVKTAERTLHQISGGLGADRIFLAVGGSSRSPVQTAARLARDRAVVVDIGKCKLDLPWNAYYEKELDLRFSRSYGPGRYDPHYELDGIDYPPGYVRWTERRNLSCVLDLLANGQIDAEPLISETFPVEEAVDVYERLSAGSLEGVGFLFSYGASTERNPQPDPPINISPGLDPTRRQRFPARGRPSQDRLRAGFIGAGGFASSMLLPYLSRREDVDLAVVATNRSLSAVNAQRKFGFDRAETNADHVLADESIDAVFVVTRHSTHADFVCQALEAGKAVFVEKPLALSVAQLQRILETAARTENDRIMVGFNRRFAPMLAEMRHRFGQTGTPSVARYLINAGKLPAESWYANEGVEGSRFVGEGGHFIDVITWWIGCDPIEATAYKCDGEDLTLVLRYPDGSIGTITYVVSGHDRYPKESFDVASGGRSARLENFRLATVWTGRRARSSRSLGGMDKGHQAEIASFISAVKSHGPMPISLSSLAATTKATLAAEATAASRSSLTL